jgi:hypothetical protein
MPDRFLIPSPNGLEFAAGIERRPDDREPDNPVFTSEQTAHYGDRGRRGIVGRARDPGSFSLRVNLALILAPFVNEAALSERHGRSGFMGLRERSEMALSTLPCRTRLSSPSGRRSIRSPEQVPPKAGSSPISSRGGGLRLPVLVSERESYLGSC